MKTEIKQIDDLLHEIVDLLPISNPAHAKAEEAHKTIHDLAHQFSIGGEEWFKEWWKKEMGDVIFQPNDTLHKAIKSAFIVGFAYSGEGIRQWISVKDELPPYELDVLGYNDGEVTKCYRNKIQFIQTKNDHNGEGDYTCSIDITHWMTLPEPPK